MQRMLDELQSRIGYRFQEPTYLQQALTHSSFANETGEKKRHLLCNERLEFLGDSVLSILVSEYLYAGFPGSPEGDLTRMRSALVCEDALAGYAETISLGSCLLLGKGEQSGGGAHKPAILADAFEALLAAIYLDAGEKGKDAVSSFLLPLISRTVKGFSADLADSKSMLQVFLQKDGDIRPEYRVVQESGPDHAKHFCVEVYLDSNRIGCGEGSTKRQAEQQAATDALQLFGVLQ